MVLGGAEAEAGAEVGVEVMRVKKGENWGGGVGEEDVARGGEVFG